MTAGSSQFASARTAASCTLGFRSFTPARTASSAFGPPQRARAWSRATWTSGRTPSIAARIGSTLASRASTCFPAASTAFCAAWMSATVGAATSSLTSAG